jgi:hypothetical protein
MKACSLAILLVLLSLTSCVQRPYSEAELRTLFLGSWNTSTSFETNAADTRIVTESHGKTTFKGDGTLLSEKDTLMRITVPEGDVPVAYHAIVHGNWSIDGQNFRTSRISEEINPKDEFSRKFIEREEMRKLRSQSPTNSVYTLRHISPRKIVALDAQGARTTYGRDE